MNRKALLFFLILFFLAVEAKEKICLNMIVKNEKDVIRRCLDSVIPVIDYWVIVDTGSTDGTQKIIKEHLKGIPGKLYERSWKNWGETRTEALKLAQTKGQGDYILFMDADDVLEFSGPPEFPPLDSELYSMWRGSKEFTYLKPQLLKRDFPAKWVGVTHEYLSLEGSYTSKTLEGVKYVTLEGGAAAKDPKQKFRKNVELLEKGLKEEPKNERYAFYLAESYRDAGEKGKALEWYQKRAKMGGWDEEIFWSHLQSAFMLRDLGLPSSVVIEELLHAHRFRPHRGEPVYYLADLYMLEGNYPKAYEVLKKREEIVQPEVKDSLFNMDWIDSYGLLFQLSICSYYVGQYEESIRACTQLIGIRDLPENWREQTAINLTFPLTKLGVVKDP